MSESVPFAPRPRAVRRHAPSFDVDNFLRELDVIALHIERVAATRVEAFNADDSEHDSTCIAIIRLAALLEREEYAFYINTHAPPRPTPCGLNTKSPRTQAIRAWMTSSCGRSSPATHPTFTCAYTPLPHADRNRAYR